VGVPRFEPFAALRYTVDLDDVVAPPYDVVSETEVDALAARDEHNIVHVDIPRERDGPDRYERAADRLRAWIEAGVMIGDETPSLTLYRMRFTDSAGADRDIVGVMGGLEVVDDGAGAVLPHERTTPKASTDRLDLTRATRCNLSPIWGLSLASGLTDLLTPAAEPMGSVTVDGVEHSVERLTDPERIATIRDAIGSDDVLIADGHHRYGIARTYRDEVRRSTGSEQTPAELTLAFISELVADQLSVDAIHRLYVTPGFDELRDRLAVSFDLEPAGAVDGSTLARMSKRGALCLVDAAGAGAWLLPKPGAFEGVRALDGAWLEHALRDTHVEVSYQHGVDRVLDAVRSGAAAAGVLIRPVSVAEIERTAREGLLMPPKSTFFTPKLRTGLVVRPLT
jgi:uncharacterized protein (DUF1015 family)